MVCGSAPSLPESPDPPQAVRNMPAITGTATRAALLPRRRLIEYVMVSLSGALEDVRRGVNPAPSLSDVASVTELRPVRNISLLMSGIDVVYAVLRLLDLHVRPAVSATERRRSTPDIEIGGCAGPRWTDQRAVGDGRRGPRGEPVER